MKKFLRYEISGLVFIIWLLLFYKVDDIQNIAEAYKSIESMGLLLPIFALPVGTILHQISVSIKNCIFGCCIEELDDFPKDYLKHIEHDNEDKYILKRISNLNSFYYVRFDNGFLAPVLALLISFFVKGEVNVTLVAIFIIIAILLLSYSCRIVKEIRSYENILKSKYLK